MAPPATRSHVYQRTIVADQRSSLSVIVPQIPPGARILDLGCGSGAIGRHLSERADRCVIDGVTLSTEEAALAAPYYRRVVVANLDVVSLDALFPDGVYDIIICADVLEHLSDSTHVLAACQRLLADHGRLLLSIPNAAYSGLIAELMAGEFRYRPEGLLDETHVRFFTRDSLLRFLAEQGWATVTLETVERALPDSEFKVALDALPPAVSRYLLALPDASTYQFVLSARPLKAGEALPQPRATPSTHLPARALFTAELFLKQAEGYAEAHKISATGIIGQARQTLRFALATSSAPTGLKLDLADRAGFMHLYAMRLQAANGTLLWYWHGSDAATLAQAPHQQIVLTSPDDPNAACLALLHGDDPWIELPIPGNTLSAATGGMLEVDVGWPMSADFIAMADTASQLEQLRDAHAALRLQADQIAAQYQSQLNAQETHYQAQLKSLDEQRQQQLGALTEQHQRQLSTLDGERQQQRAGLDEQHKQQLSAVEEQHPAQLRVVHERHHEQLELLAAQHQTEVDRMRLRIQALQAQANQHTIESVALARARDTVIQERDQAHRHIEFLTNSTVFRVTRPLVHAKMAVDRLLGRSAPSDHLTELAVTPQALEPADHPVDVIVPVYRGLDDTRRCVMSVLQAQCRTPWRLIVINDASPEPEVSQWLRDIASRDPRVELLENETNLGFVGTVNRGMALSTTDDVLLLNSDAEVANDWLDRIRAAAYQDQRIASVTPFSNNATICSYPRFCQDNPLPAGWSVAQLDALFARINAGQAVDVPTGVGFCMYIRRAALDAVGLFDVDNFGKGYGEENDFCIRAADAGWRNLHLLDTFVHHSGGVSFGDAKSPRERAAMETLRRLHPRYEADVMRFVQADPARPARIAVDLARALQGGQHPVILAVLHDRQGGTERHVSELAASLQERARYFVLRPYPENRVQLRLPDPDEGFEMLFSLPGQYPDLLTVLRQLGVQHIHYHHLLGQGALVRQLPERLGVTYDFTAHDFYTICPQISLTDRHNAYCGELGVDQCNTCLTHSPAPGGMDIITWRHHHIVFLQGVRYVIAPSTDVLARIAPLVPKGRLRAVPHTDIDTAVPLPQPKPAPLKNGRPLKVAVIGALSIIKGADVLEQVALLAAKQGAAVEFHLIGYAYRALRTRPRSHLTVRGQYDEKDLPALLDWLQPDLVWFPAQWPETYSYTLSACLAAGLPVVAPDLGAFSERLSGRRWTWVRPWNESAAQWLAFFEEIRARHFAQGQSPEPQWRLQTEASRRLPEGVVVQSTDWYLGEYLVDIPAVPGITGPAPSITEAFAPKTVAGAAPGTKVRVLNLLVRLRSTPLLSPVARAIPLRWQTRVKSWLRQ